MLGAGMPVWPNSGNHALGLKAIRSINVSIRIYLKHWRTPGYCRGSIEVREAECVCVCVWKLYSRGRCWRNGRFRPSHASLSFTLTAMCPVASERAGRVSKWACTRLFTWVQSTCASPSRKRINPWWMKPWKVECQGSKVMILSKTVLSVAFLARHFQILVTVRLCASIDYGSGSQTFFYTH